MIFDICGSISADFELSDKLRIQFSVGSPIDTMTIDLQGEIAEPTGENDYEYTVENGRATITKYVGMSRKPFVPSRLGGAPVTVIGAGSFVDTDVEWVYIPEGVEEIK